MIYYVNFPSQIFNILISLNSLDITEEMLYNCTYSVNSCWFSADFALAVRSGKVADP